MFQTICLYRRRWNRAHRKRCTFSLVKKWISHFTFIIEARPGGRGGVPCRPSEFFKHLVSLFINACRLLSAFPSLSQFGRGRLSLVAISFYALSLLFGPCCLSEFTLAELHNRIKVREVGKTIVLYEDPPWLGLVELCKTLSIIRR